MDNKLPLNKPVVLDKSFDRNSFDCGSLPLNEYLQKYALQNQKKGSTRTYVATRGERIVGYYSLSYGSVSTIETPKKISKGLGKYPVPIILLARLAIDLSEQGQGLGKALLRNALLRSIQASEIAGLRAILVHAKDESAKNYYQKFGFESSPINEYHLFLLLSDVKKTYASVFEEKDK